MKIKHIQLRDFDLNHVAPFRPEKGIEIKWYQDEESKRNHQTYASFIGNKSDINNQLSVLNNRIESERIRTLNGIPKCRIVDDKQIGIY